MPTMEVEMEPPESSRPPLHWNMLMMSAGCVLTAAACFALQMIEAKLKGIRASLTTDLTSRLQRHAAAFTSLSNVDDMVKSILCTPGKFKLHNQIRLKSGELFSGYNAVQSWQLAFNWEQAVNFQVRDVCAHVLTDMALVTIKTYVDDHLDTGPFNVTNVFEFHNARWYMVHHHSSVLDEVEHQNA
ncbi:hypothetical protein M0R45_024152 [Rubus argutus]|uniref:SnoaL-like domain-containing protein n=1 Tax=Rubus argutus TaxID=59490 RepID=A0AAW1WSB9_RUBAR